ncbi:hypothetical protein BDW22DRAFT_1362769 [Trametopsis cervina]|nr:hypothetical protein BDW22DRAFT_1362769 [Trametopsis cervina]
MSSKPPSKRRSPSQASARGFLAPHHHHHQPSATTTTGLSRVFAQPLQGSPLRSAIDQLDVHVLADADARSTLGEDERASIRTSASMRDADGVGLKRKRSSQHTLALADGEGSSSASSESSESRVPESPASAVLKEAEPELQPYSIDDTQAPPPPPTQPIPISTPSQPTRTPSAPNSKPSSYHLQPAPVPSPPSRASWFGSLSRTRGKAASIVSISNSQQFESTSPPPPQSADATPIQPESEPQPSTTPSTSPPPSQIQVQSQATRPPAPPRQLTNSDSLASVASIDASDEVPPPIVLLPTDRNNTQEAEAEEGQTTLTLTHKPSASGLNPSASRFVLRIPLLGRPKMALGDVVGHSARPTQEDAVKYPALETRKDKEEEEKTVVPEVVVSQPSDESLASDSVEEPAAPESEPELEPVSSTVEAPEGGGEAPNGVNNVPPSSSWWSYLAWSPATSSEEVNNQQQQPQQQQEAPRLEISTSATGEEGGLLSGSPEDMTAQPETTPSEAVPTPDPASPPQTPTPDTKNPETDPNNPDPQNPEAPKQQTPSIFSAETAKSQNSSTWYSPWNWYAASPIVPASSSAVGAPDGSGEADGMPSSGSGVPDGMPESGSGVLDGRREAEGEQGSGKKEDGAVKTESELVKEEALARDIDTEAKPADADVTPTEPPKTSPLPSPSATITVNPIESSISTNKSGWASFFMSKTLFVKSITDGSEVSKSGEHGEGEGEGMEVMDIDEEDEAAESAPLTKAVAIAPKKPRSIAPASTSTSPRPLSPPAPPPPKEREREPKKQGAPAPPLTNSDSIKKETARVIDTNTRAPSPTPSKTSSVGGVGGGAGAGSPRVTPPNLVLPTWDDTFLAEPRSLPPPKPASPAAGTGGAGAGGGGGKGTLGKTLDFVSVLWAGKDERRAKGKGKAKDTSRDAEAENKAEREAAQGPFATFGMQLPKALDVAGEAFRFQPGELDGRCRVVVIGVAGWMPGTITRTLAGGLPSSSTKFVDLTCTALEKFEEEHGFRFKKITRMPLEGDGTTERKLARIHSHLLGNEEWVQDLHAADVIFVSAHSQGSVVAAHLIDKLISEGHIMTSRNVDILARAAAAVAPPGTALPAAATGRTQRVCCLALCGVHLGPLRYLRTHSLLQPYIQYFENAAARELFDFQDTETEASKKYVKALGNVMDHGTKMVYVASLNDQVVPIYSGLFTAASHPRILRALYIDGDAYHSSDFLSNLLVLLIRIMNSSLSDSGLLAHLSEATAGTLSGIGHSSAYEELASYQLAVNYLFLTTDGAEGDEHPLVVEPFNAVDEQNDYEIPWSLRDLIADERVAHFFAAEFSQLKDAFDQWAPKTTILRDVKRKLQPIQRLSSIKGSSFASRL